METVVVQPNLGPKPAPHESLAVASFGAFGNRIPRVRGHYHYATFGYYTTRTPNTYVLQIQGLMGFANYTAPILVAIEYYDAAQRATVREWQIAGGGQSPTQVSIVAGGSQDGRTEGAFEIRVAVFPLSGTIPGIGPAARFLGRVGRVANRLGDAIDGINVNPSYRISLIQVAPAPRPPQFAGLQCTAENPYGRSADNRIMTIIRW